MANEAEVRPVAGWVRESDAEAALDALPGSLSPDVYAAIARLCEPEIQLSRDGRLRQWSSEPHQVALDPLVFEAAARLAKLAGLRPEQFIEQAYQTPRALACALGNHMPATNTAPSSGKLHVVLHEIDLAIQWAPVLDYCRHLERDGVTLVSAELTHDDITLRFGKTIEGGTQLRRRYTATRASMKQGSDHWDFLRQHIDAFVRGDPSDGEYTVGGT